MILPTISVAIPTRNEPDQLAATVHRAIETRTTSTPIEFAVVDDASDCDGLAGLTNETSGFPLRKYRSKCRLGVARARNCAATLATGDILFITDSHVEFVEGWDRLVLDNIEERRILAATISDMASGFLGYGCHLVVPFMGTHWNRSVTEDRHVQVASSAGTVLTRELFKALGGFDEGMLLYGGAEPEFSVRAWLFGAEIFSVPELVVRHRFKTRLNRYGLISSIRTLLLHNNLRFGLLYLSHLASLEMIRHHALLFPNHIEEALRMVHESDVWERRARHERLLPKRFDWFVKKFNLKDDQGRRIVFQEQDLIPDSEQPRSSSKGAKE